MTKRIIKRPTKEAERERQRLYRVATLAASQREHSELIKAGIRLMATSSPDERKAHHTRMNTLRTRRYRARLKLKALKAKRLAAVERALTNAKQRAG